MLKMTFTQLSPTIRHRCCRLFASSLIFQRFEQLNLCYRSMVVVVGGIRINGGAPSSSSWWTIIVSMRPGLTVPRRDKWYPPLPYASSAFAVVPPLLRESSIEGKRVDGPLAASTDYERRYPRWEVNTLYKRMQGIDNVANPLFPSSLSLFLSLSRSFSLERSIRMKVIPYFSTIYRMQRIWKRDE